MEKNNCIANKFRSGRPKLLNPRGVRKLKKIVNSNRCTTLRKITSELQTSIQGKISLTTVRRRLHQLGFSARIPQANARTLNSHDYVVYRTTFTDSTWECRVNATVKVNVKNDGIMQSKTEVAGVSGSRE